SEQGCHGIQFFHGSPLTDWGLSGTAVKWKAFTVMSATRLSCALCHIKPGGQPARRDAGACLLGLPMVCCSNATWPAL
ncbi:MAG: hypothetical protein ABL896_09155, partial [Hylemonella sp.]